MNLIDLLATTVSQESLDDITTGQVPFQVKLGQAEYSSWNSCWDSDGRMVWCCLHSAKARGHQVDQVPWQLPAGVDALLFIWWGSRAVIRRSTMVYHIKSVCQDDRDLREERQKMGVENAPWKRLIVASPGIWSRPSLTNSDNLCWNSCANLVSMPLGLQHLHRAQAWHGDMIEEFDQSYLQYITVPGI